MKLFSKKGAVNVSGILFLTVGCATTTDPYECANRGIGAVTCQGAVAAETEIRRETLQKEQGALSDQLQELEAAQEKEATLQARVNALKGRLLKQQAAISDLMASIEGLRETNRVTEGRYKQLIEELNEVNAKVDRFSNLQTPAYSDDTADELEGFLDGEVAILTSTIERELGL